MGPINVEDLTSAIDELFRVDRTSIARVDIKTGDQTLSFQVADDGWFLVPEHSR